MPCQNMQLSCFFVCMFFWIRVIMTSLNIKPVWFNSRKSYLMLLHSAAWTVSMQVSQGNLRCSKPSAESLGSHVEKKLAINCPCTWDSLATCSHQKHTVRENLSANWNYICFNLHIRYKCRSRKTPKASNQQQTDWLIQNKALRINS